MNPLTEDPFSVLFENLSCLGCGWTGILNDIEDNDEGKSYCPECHTEELVTYAQ